MVLVLKDSKYIIIFFIIPFEWTDFTLSYSIAPIPVTSISITDLASSFLIIGDHNQQLRKIVQKLDISLMQIFLTWEAMRLWEL